MKRKLQPPNSSIREVLRRPYPFERITSAPVIVIRTWSVPVT
jgi:hypothetical protein